MSCRDVSPKGDPPGFTLVLDDTTTGFGARSPGDRKALERPDDSLNELERSYGPAYAAKLYR